MKEEPLVPVIVGPADAPVYELLGSRDSAPGKGKKTHPYNPNKDFNLEDYGVLQLGSKPNPSAKPGVVEASTYKSAKVTWKLLLFNPFEEEPRSITIANRMAQPEEAGKVQSAALVQGPAPREPHGIMWTLGTDVPYDEYDIPFDCCYNCWSPDHNRGQCPRLNTQHCRNCRRRDVDVASCIRCGPELQKHKANERIRKKELERRKWEESRESRSRDRGADRMRGRRISYVRAGPSSRDRLQVSIRQDNLTRCEKYGEDNCSRNVLPAHAADRQHFNGQSAAPGGHLSARSRRSYGASTSKPAGADQRNSPLAREDGP